MKKNILMFLLIVAMMFSLVGCEKCISTEYQNVEVNVVDKYYRGTWIQPIIYGKVRTAITHPPVYQIKVEYNNIEYTISDRDTYNKYKDKIEQTAVGTLEINKYDDGTVRYDIISLE